MKVLTKYLQCYYKTVSVIFQLKSVQSQLQAELKEQIAELKASVNATKEEVNITWQTSIFLMKVQGAKKVLAPPIMQNMAYFLSFHAKVMQKNHLT